MEEEKKIYRCTLLGGCHFQSDSNTCQLEGTMCSYRKEETDGKNSGKKSEKWFEKYYK